MPSRARRFGLLKRASNHRSPPLQPVNPTIPDPLILPEENHEP